MALMETLRVGDVLLDLGAGCLRGGDGAEIALRPKAFDLLAALVRNPRQTLSRDELLAAIWPGVTVTEESVTQCVREVRRAIGDPDGHLLRTVARRGYRLDLGVVPVALADDRVTAALKCAEPSMPSPVTAVDRPNKPSIPIIAPRLSIAVLPFANLSDEPEQQYFADGLTEDLTTDLSRIAGMFVVSCNSAFTYKGKGISTRQIGQELGVNYILEGSVRRSGDRIRVTAQLIDAATDAHLWAERFDRDAGDLFALQDEITTSIAVALDVEVIAAEAKRTVEHPNAIDYVLRGRAVLNRTKTRENAVEAASLFERALELDPESGIVQCCFARLLISRALDGHSDTAESDVRRAAELVNHALAQLPNESLVHFAKGNVLRAQRRYAEAIEEYEVALKLNRNLLAAHAHIGRCKLCLGEVEEVIPRHELVIRLSPRDPNLDRWFSRIGEAHLLMMRLDEARYWLERALNANPGGDPCYRLWLTAVHALQGHTDLAVAELAEARRRLRDKDRYSSIARVLASSFFYAVPAVRTLLEPTLLAGLRKAGMPET